MKLHEYQAKRILTQSGISAPDGEMAQTSTEVFDIAERFGGKAVVKAQIHAGGRGVAGGIKVVSSSKEAEKVAASMLGTRLVTHQTDSDGAHIQSVLVEEVLDIKDEFYAGMVIDGASKAIICMVSQEGGVDIEEVADKTPDKIIRVIVDPMLGLMPYQIRTLSKGLSSEKALNGSIATLLRNMYEIFVRYDLSMIEINPLVIVQDGRLLAADAKFNIDDDAIFRHPELLTLRDPEQDAILEARAREHGISYVKLDGNVGCMVNGAGLAMATMDVIDAAGALPANFLDVGGGADEKKVEEAMGIILSDPNVEKILINIFGGILRCDIVSRGILSAFNSNLDANLPLVVRMLGTNAEEGRKLLENSNLEVTLVYDLDDAAGVVNIVV